MRTRSCTPGHAGMALLIDQWLWAAAPARCAGACGSRPAGRAPWPCRRWAGVSSSMGHTWQSPWFLVHRVPQDASRKRHGGPGTAKHQQTRERSLRAPASVAESCLAVLAGPGHLWPDRVGLRRRGTEREAPGWAWRTGTRRHRRGRRLGGRRGTAQGCHRRVEGQCLLRLGGVRR